MDNNKSLYDQKNSGLAFSLSAVVPIILAFVFSVVLQIIATSKAGDTAEIIQGYTKQNWYVYMSFLISQIGFALIILYFLRAKKLNVFCEFKQKFELKYLLIGLAISLGLLFGLSYVNTFFVGFLKKIGLNPPDVNVPVMGNFGGFLLSILVIAILPAFIEELLFRGIILGGIKGLGTLHAVLATGILFAIFHQSPSQTVYQFISGAVFALLVLKAGSVIPAVILHFINNAYILSMYFFAPDYVMGKTLSIILTIVSLLVFAAAVVYLIFFDKKRTYPKKEGSKIFYVYALAGIAMSLFVWILGLFS